MLKHMVAAKVYKSIQEMRRGCSNILRCLFQIGFLTKDVRGGYYGSYVYPPLNESLDRMGLKCEKTFKRGKR